MRTRTSVVLSALAVAGLACAGPTCARNSKPAAPPAVKHEDTMSGAQLDGAFARVVAQHEGEYAVARAELLRDPGARPYLERKRDQPADWHERLAAETLLGWLDHKAEYDEAQAWVQDPSRRPNNTALGHYRPSDLAKRLANLGAVVTPRVLEMWRKTHEYDDDYEEQVLFLALRELHDPRAYEPVLELLDDRQQTQRTREGAVAVLQALADARALPALRALLLDGGEPDSLRDQAARALITLHAPDARDVLERLLFEPALSPELRREIALRLFELRDPASLPALQRALQSFQEPELTSALCLSFGAFGDKSHVPLLRKELAKISDPSAEQTCREAIADLEDRP
jgi:hypothetical protein